MDRPEHLNSDGDVKAYWDWYRSLTFRERLEENGWRGWFLYSKAGNALMFFGTIAAVAVLALLLH